MSENAHSCVQVRLKCNTDGKRDVSETCQNRYLDIAVEYFALQVLEQEIHEVVGILSTLVTKGSRDVANDADRHGTELGVFVTLQSGIKERQERLDVWREILLERYSDNCQMGVKVTRKCSNQQLMSPQQGKHLPIQ